jgi:CheY-like chemotaxis protein
MMTFQVPAGCRVFVLDDTQDRLDWFRTRLPEMRCATTAAAALEILSTEHFDLVFLDHDLSFMDAGFPERQFGNGKEVARYLAYSKFAGKVVIHSRSEQAPAMAKILPQAEVSRFGDFEIIQAEPPAPKPSVLSHRAAAR